MPGVLGIYDATGQALSRIDHQLGSESLFLELAPSTTYYVGVERQNGVVGGNDFYFLHGFASATTNPPESEPNDTAGTADPYGAVTQGYVLGSIAPVSDVDYLSFTATAGETFTLACGAAREGAGLVGFTVDLRDGADTTTLQSDTESLAADMRWGTAANATQSPVTIPATGTYLLRMSAMGDVADVASKHYLCGFTVQ
jgi:hypothetical protein